MSVCVCRNKHVPLILVQHDPRSYGEKADYLSLLSKKFSRITCSSELTAYMINHALKGNPAHVFDRPGWYQQYGSVMGCLFSLVLVATSTKNWKAEMIVKWRESFIQIHYMGEAGQSQDKGLDLLCGSFIDCILVRRDLCDWQNGIIWFWFIGLSI